MFEKTSLEDGLTLMPRFIWKLRLACFPFVHFLQWIHQKLWVHHNSNRAHRVFFIKRYNCTIAGNVINFMGVYLLYWWLYCVTPFCRWYNPLIKSDRSLPDKGIKSCPSRRETRHQLSSLQAARQRPTNTVEDFASARASQAIFTVDRWSAVFTFNNCFPASQSPPLLNVTPPSLQTHAKARPLLTFDSFHRDGQNT